MPSSLAGDASRRLLADGSIHATSTIDELWRLDPRSMSWVQVRPDVEEVQHVTEWPRSRERHTAVEVGGRMFVWGGRTLGGALETGMTDGWSMSRGKLEEETVTVAGGTLKDGGNLWIPLNVSGIVGGREMCVRSVTVTLTGLSHGCERDIRAVLLGPGTRVRSASWTASGGQEQLRGRMDFPSGKGPRDKPVMLFGHGVRQSLSRKRGKECSCTP